MTKHSQAKAPKKVKAKKTKPKDNILILPPTVNKRKLLAAIEKQSAPKVKIGKLHPLPATEWGLQDIKKRYFFPGISAINNRPVNGMSAIKHHADCAIYRSLERYEFCFCSCGLLHDLEKNLADTGLIEVVYPRYWHDYYLQERGEDNDTDTIETKIAKEQEREECQRVLYEIFGPPTRTSLAQIKKDYEASKKLLLKVFGKTFANALFQLDELLKKEIENYRKYERYKLGGTSSS